RAKCDGRRPEEAGSADDRAGKLGKRKPAVAGPQVFGGDLQQGNDGHHTNAERSAACGVLGYKLHYASVLGALAKGCPARPQERASRRHFGISRPRCRSSARKRHWSDRGRFAPGWLLPPTLDRHERSDVTSRQEDQHPWD